MFPTPVTWRTARPPLGRQERANPNALAQCGLQLSIDRRNSR
jgi:hypothetical protein